MDVGEHQSCTPTSLHAQFGIHQMASTLNVYAWFEWFVFLAVNHFTEYGGVLVVCCCHGDQSMYVPPQGESLSPLELSCRGRNSLMGVMGQVC